MLDVGDVGCWGCGMLIYKMPHSDKRKLIERFIDKNV